MSDWAGSSIAGNERRTVLVVDDDREVREFYGDALAERYAVRLAADGAEALDRLDESVGVVLLDRRMPGPGGYDVVAAIRDRDVDVCVVLVTAVPVDLDVVDVECDDYLTKPVSAETLRDAVDRMLDRSRYDERFREYFAVASKKATLETTRDTAALGEDDRYARLERRFRELGEQLDEAVHALERRRPGTAFRELL